MRKMILFFSILISLVGCLEIEKVKKSCRVFLTDGSTLEISEDIRINNKTGTITYRDAEGNLWSLFETAYDSLDCSPR